MNNYRLKYYIFLDELNEKIIKNIQNLKKRKIDLKLIVSEKILFSILDFVKYSKIPFFIIDNVKLATKHKANGIFLTSKNRSLINITKGSQRIEVIGSAHNQYEYFIKERQGCSTIFLSPIFYNKKYSFNKILHIQNLHVRPITHITFGYNQGTNQSPLVGSTGDVSRPSTRREALGRRGRR